MLGISHLLDRSLTKISGGERQRVSIGRAIVRRPKLFLFDEPFMSLDLKLREQLRVELKMIQERLGTASIFVSSDPAEALTVGDRVASMDGGRLLQVADPRKLYEDPASIVVGDQMTVPRLNTLTVRLDDLTGQGWRPSLADCLEGAVPGPGADQSMVVAFRPEETHLTAGEGGVPMRVRLVESLGSYRLVHCVTQSGHRIVCHHRGPAPAVDSMVFADVDAGRLMYFDPENGRRVRVPASV